jgi:hypothetical protein
MLNFYNFQLVNDFSKPGGDGEKLQAFLEKRAKNSDNWVIVK